MAARLWRAVPRSQVLVAAVLQPIGDGVRRHGGAIRGPLRSQPVARLFLDQELDQGQPLVLVVRLEQQTVIAVIVETQILLTHATPPQLRHTLCELFPIGNNRASTILRGTPPSMQ